MASCYYWCWFSDLRHNNKYGVSLKYLYSDDTFAELSLAPPDFIAFVSKHHDPEVKIVMAGWKPPGFLRDLLFTTRVHESVKLYLVNYATDWWPPITTDPYVPPSIGTDQDTAANEAYTILNNLDTLRVSYLHCVDSETYSYFWNKHVSTCKNVLYWSDSCAYPDCLTQFNENPINKVLVSGCCKPTAYPERDMMLGLNNVEQKPYVAECDNGAYSRYLNNYLCSFVGPVHVRRTGSMEHEYNKIVVLKVFETLGSGALLLVPRIYEEVLNKIGLFDKENCMVVDMGEASGIQDTIDFITNKANRALIDEIRRNGQICAETKFTPMNKFTELKNLVIAD